MIRLEHISKTFKTKDGNVHALKDVSIHVKKGMIYGIIGYSGAGKSTLVRCINLLEVPDEGKVIFDGQNLLELNEKGLREARQKMGMIFQHFNLMSAQTVFDNIALPMRMEKKSKEEIEKKVTELLELIDLADRRDSYPSQLSGGQKQRVAIARALASDPKVLLCDESTSALDPQTTQSILKLIRDINKKLGLTVVVITHEMLVVKEICDRVAVMDAGRIVEKNDIIPLFTNPIEELTQNFINTTNSSNKIYELIESNSSLIDLNPGDRMVRLIGAENAPADYISRIARDFGVDFSLLLADGQIIQNQPVSILTGILKGDPADIEKSLQYLRDQNIRIEFFDKNLTDVLEQERR